MTLMNERSGWKEDTRHILDHSDISLNTLVIIMLVKKNGDTDNLESNNFSMTFIYQNPLEFEQS
jgi:hypothetical protein